MFRGFVCVLTAAAVFWHSVVGCCAHHAHAAPPNITSENAGGASSAPHHAGATHEHRAACDCERGPHFATHAMHPAGAIPEAQRPCESPCDHPSENAAECPQGSCAFITSQPAPEVTSTGPDGWTSMVAVAAARAQQWRLAMFSSADETPAPGNTGGRDRLRLIHVLVI